MSLHLGLARLTIDQNGRKVLDTEDKLYHNITTGLSGSYVAPARSVSGWGVINIDRNILVGSCNGFCTHVQGSVRFTGQHHAIPPDIWYCYEGGDLIWTLDKHTGFQNPTWAINPTGIVKYRFFVSSGKVYLNERVFFTSSVTLIVPTHAILWRLKAGRFT